MTFDSGDSGGHLDHMGDPLPPGATQRLGTRRMQYALEDVAYSADGAKAYVISGPELHEWQLDRGECTAVYPVSNSRLTAMACSRDVRTALLADASGAVIHWDLTRRREVERVETGRTAIGSVHLAPDGERVLTLDVDTGTTEEWRLACGTRLVSIALPGERFLHCCYAPDGVTAFVAHTPGHNIYHFDLRTGETLSTFVEDYTCYDMCLSADCERLLVGTRHQASEWRLADRQSLAAFSGHQGHAVGAVAYARNDRLVLTGARDGSIRLWDRQRIEVLRRWSPHTALVRRLRVSPDGKWVLSHGEDHLLIETSLQTGEPRLPWARHLAAVTAVAFSPGGSRLATGSRDRAIRLWDARTWRTVRTIQNPGTEVHGVAFAPDGGDVAVASKDGTVRLFGVRENKEGATAGGRGASDSRGAGQGMVAPGKQTAAHGGTAEKDGTAQAGVAAADGQVVQNGDVAQDTGVVIGTHRGYARAVVFAGQLLVSAGDDGLICVWDPATGQRLQTLEGHTGGVLSLAVSGDGARALSGGRDGTVREWDLVTGDQLHAMLAHRGWVNAVAYADECHRALSAGRDGLVVEWDLDEGQDVRCLNQGEWIQAVCLVGGSAICAAGENGVVRVWDRQTGRELARLRGHEGAINTLVARADSGTVVSGSADSTALIWSLR